MFKHIYINNKIMWLGSVCVLWLDLSSLAFRSARQLLCRMSFFLTQRKMSHSLLSASRSRPSILCIWDTVNGSHSVLFYNHCVYWGLIKLLQRYLFIFAVHIKLERKIWVRAHTHAHAHIMNDEKLHLCGAQSIAWWMPINEMIWFHCWAHSNRMIEIAGAARRHNKRRR